MTRRRAVPALLAAMLAIAAGGCGPGGDADAGRSVPGGADLPAPAASALSVGTPEALDRASATVWATVRADGVVRSAPRAGAPVVGRLPLRTPEGTVNIVLVLRDGGDWVRVAFPAPPGRARGWVPGSALGAGGVSTTSIRIDRAARTLRLYAGSEEVLAVPVGVGTAEHPTPAGAFYIRNRLAKYASPAYGPVAFGTSARSQTVTDWPGGGWVGIHGTDRPDLIPGAVSHGCIRLRNADVLALSELIDVGTRVEVT